MTQDVRRSLGMIDRTMIRVPTAMCHIKSQTYTGIAEVLCLENTIKDLIVGNVDGVCDDAPCVTTIDVESHEEKCEKPIRVNPFCHTLGSRPL